jgi:hypothetical protein
MIKFSPCFGQLVRFEPIAYTTRYCQCERRVERAQPQRSIIFSNYAHLIYFYFPVVQLGIRFSCEPDVCCRCSSDTVWPFLLYSFVLVC